MPPAQRPTNVHYYVLAALLVITAVNYIQRNCISPAATTIEETTGIGRIQLDLAAGAFFLAYTLLQVPSGWLAKAWGPRLALSVYATGWSLALAASAAATGFLGLYIARIFMGIFQAGIFPCATLILAVWWPASQRGTATALLNSFMLVGGAAGTMVAGRLLEPLGWRYLFVLYALPGVLWAVWFLWWFRNRPEDHPGVNSAELAMLGTPKPPGEDEAPGEPGARSADDRIQADDAAIIGPAGAAPSPAAAQVPEAAIPPVTTGGRDVTSWLIVFSLPLLLLYTQQCFRAAAPRLFDSRLPTYLEEERGLTKKSAADLSTWPMWAGVVGGLCGGALSDYILRRTGSRRAGRNGVAIGSLVVAILWYLAAYTVTDVYQATALLAAGSFFFNFSSPCAYALTIDIGGKHLPTVFGLMNMIGNVGAWLFVSGVMFLVSVGGWPLAFGVWLGLHVAAILCWLFLDPSMSIGEAN